MTAHTGTRHPGRMVKAVGCVLPEHNARKARNKHWSQWKPTQNSSCYKRVERHSPQQQADKTSDHSQAISTSERFGKHTHRGQERQCGSVRSQGHTGCFKGSPHHR